MQLLTGFYSSVQHDPRIGATHISLYMALFIRWLENGCRNPVLFKSSDIMPLARIGSRATYHKCLRDLVEAGYVEYLPSTHATVRCMVWMKG